MNRFINFPPLLLPFTRKNKAWRKKCVDWADTKSFFNYSPVRNSVLHKKINYDLVNGKIHMDDIIKMLNPEDIKTKYIPDSIQHYGIINSKLNVLKGEESKRIFDYKVVVTNPTAISEIENNKRDELYERVKEMIMNTSQSEEEFNAELEKVSDFFTYEWQDAREIRANAFISHYRKEIGFDILFNRGFSDACCVGEEIYHCDIVGGEPTIERVDPLKIRVFRSGYSNKIEDADMIILEDYWSPGRVIDTYYDVLTKKDFDYLESHSHSKGHDSMDNVDERLGFIPAIEVDNNLTSEPGFFFDPLGKSDNLQSNLLPFDSYGNVRVMRVYWKSKRRIKKVKSYDLETGEELFNFYPENYIINKDLGEEEQIFYINEAWEGTKIGDEIYVNMRPRVVQYNRLSNPSRCHFGIVGSIYNLNDDRPFSLVDMMKPYNYLYDVTHDRLNKLLAKNKGKVMVLDISKVPAGWSMEKYMYFIESNNIAVIDSFKEGNVGAATGKLAGALNNASSGVIDLELANTIRATIELLEYIKQEMADVVGISKQREGQIANRETVGGVERATLLSSYITEWLFVVHEDVKKRAIEAFIETAKIAMKGRKKKFQYILSDGSTLIMEIDGDEFAECDYGLVVDNSQGTQELAQKMEMLAQAALQNQLLNFSTIMKLYSSSSIIEKQRMVEKNEKELLERQQQAQQQQQQAQQQQLQMEAQFKEAQMQQQDALNARDNETRVLVAQINSQAEADRLALMNGDFDGRRETERAKLEESQRQFNEKMRIERDKLNLDIKKQKEDAALKRQAINKKSLSK